MEIFTAALSASDVAFGRALWQHITDLGELLLDILPFVD